MGKIYEAVQEPLGRPVALKVLDLHDAGPEFRRRFFLEAATCAKLTHPNTVRIYDYGETDDGVYYIVMELIRGQTLHHLLEHSPPLPPARVIRMARQLCAALAEAHDAGIVHRDLKPANIFVTPHGDEPDFVKVVDFGLVKEMGKESELSRTGHVLGSPMYMAPEQIHNTAVDARTDVYAVGLILYALLTGKTPFKRGNPLAVLMAQANQKPPTFREVAPDVVVPASLEWLVMSCIAKRPEDRPASMHEMLRGLKAIAKELQEHGPSLRMELVGGRISLPQGVDVSEEVQLPVPPGDAPLQAGGSTTLVQQSQAERSQRTRAIVLVGTTGALAFGGAAVLIVAALLGFAWMMWGPSPASVVAEETVEVAAPVEPVVVSLVSEPPGAEVERDGVLLGMTPLTLRVPAGEAWIVVVEAPGHAPRTVQVAGEQPELVVALEPLAGPPPTGAPAAAPSSPVPTPAAGPEPAPVAAPAPAVQDPGEAPIRRGSDIRSPWD